MKTPRKARKRQRHPKVWPLWLTKKRRRRAAPSANYLHPLTRALGQTIKAWREAHGLKATAVADLAKLSRSALAELERGEVWFSINVAMRICDAMGLCIAVATGEALRRAGRLPR